MKETAPESSSVMYNGDPFQVSIRPRTTSTSDDEPRDAVIELHELKHRGARTPAQDYCDTRYDHGVGAGAGASSLGSTGTSNVDTVLYEKEIQPGDTLQSIALSHHVTVSELKRVNNLVNDQDFFALRFIKVPIKKYGILSERVSELTVQEVRGHLGDEVRSWDQSPEGSTYGDLNENYEADSDDSSDTRALLIRTLSIRDSLSSGKQTKDARKFLQRMDVDLEKIRSSTNSYKGSLDEVRETLTCKRIIPLQSQNAWNGADCGIRWWSPLLAVVILGLFLPLLYFIYYHYSSDDGKSSV